MDQISVTLDGVEPYVRLSLLDARLNEQQLDHNLWRTTVELSPGPYLARFRTSLWESKEPFVVLPGDSSLKIVPKQVDRVMVRSAAPLEHTSGFQQSDAALATDLSRRPPVSIQRRKTAGRLFLMLRTSLRGAFGPGLWEGISLFGNSGKPVADLAPIGFPDLPPGIACAYIALPDGPYRICFAAGRKGFVSQFFFVAPGHETRIFVQDERPHATPEDSDNPPAAEWFRARFSLHFAPAGSGFDSSSASLLVAEELMNILHDDGHPRPAPECRELVDTSRSPALDLAFCLTQTNPWGDGTAPPKLIRRLNEQLPVVPDVIVMKGVVADDSPGYDLSEPPMTMRAWETTLWGEAVDYFRIPPDSTLAHVAAKRIRSGPWLRFASRKPAPSKQTARRELPTGLAGFDFDSTEFEHLVSSLRKRVRSEAAMRIPYESRDFGAAERRLLDLICPEADNLAYRILRDSEKARLHDVDGESPAPTTGSGEPISPASETLESILPLGRGLPSREELVRALQLPTRAIEQLATNVIAKLSECTLLPTREQLDAFTIDESAGNSVVLEPLQLLSRLDSEVVHCAEEKPLPVLSLVYLCYRGKAGAEEKPLTAREAADLLNGLGFIVKDSDRNVSEADIRTALKRAEELLSGDWNTLDTHDPLPIEGGIWESLEVTFADPLHYEPGTLCRILARPADLSPPLAQWWNDHEFSYSLSLGMASDPSRWHDRAVGWKTGGQSSSSPAERDPAAERRYLRMVKRNQKVSPRTLRSLLEAQDEY